MKYKLVIQPPALEDLEEAYDWIRQRAAEAAARWSLRVGQFLWCSRLGCTNARAEM